MKTTLTARQQRECDFYEEYAKRSAPDEVPLDAALGTETRPWNAYWFVCELVKARSVAGDQKLLDFGCGHGYYSVLFAKMGYEVYGVDIAPQNIAHANRLAEKYGLAERMHFSVGMAEQLDYPAEYFDIVVGIDILHHVEIDPAVRECLRTLKPGGVAVFKEPVEAPVFDALRNSRFGRWLAPKSASYERHITEDERKLTSDDIRAIRRLCPDLSIRQFRVISRLSRFVNNTTALAKADDRLIRLLPFLRRFAGTVVLTLTKAQ